ncbi:FecR domain-containing protein [Marinobacter sp.]|uniref:FecR family protein n=1 Tax=Marinobacter sp. TaxID=50741 RepID=UPI00384D2439
MQEPFSPAFFVRSRSWLLIIFVLLVPAKAHAELPLAAGSEVRTVGGAVNGMPEWRYSLAPDETFQAAADALLATKFSRQQLAQYNRINDPQRIKEGDTIRIPLAWLRRQPEPATSIAVSGQTWLRRASTGVNEPLQPQTQIRVGDEIITQAGFATVQLGNGSVLRVQPNSRLMFNSLTQYGRTGMVDTRMRLERGKISTDVEPLVEEGSRFEIETPSAVAAVRGTRFTLESGPRGSRLRVTEGGVDFGPPGRSLRIPAGYGASVSAGSSQEPRVLKLPPAPELAGLADRITRLPADLGWASSLAPAHQLDIFDAENGHTVVSRRVSESPVNLKELDNGRYRVQLAALNSDGLAGMPTTQTIDVDLQARAAELLEPPAGATLDNDTPEFSWTFRGDSEVGRVELSETGDFGNLVATSSWGSDTSALPSRSLSPGQYYWRVVTEAGGNSVAMSAPRKLVINGTLPPARIININYIDSQVRIFWQKVDTASDYLLQLSEDPAFRNIVKEATVSDTTAALRLIPGRRYFVRLKALSDGPLASRWGPGRELFIE